MAILTKPFQVVWNEETKEIIKKGGNATYTNQACFEADTLKEVEDKIKEKGLKEMEEKKAK